ncbi:sugar ABC transporter ATP-binding protein [Rhizobium rhizogenes]|uniref:Sugar ABC transporter n=1 Tax=Rhizobium rhizogenes (strain K84 / ATCC BAA-868) TaxID=311403 RepID=B9JKM6_RHIR8|nr:sugar ABC transporter ATP-binding protein [Rhizobium rhizogenes]ACM30468.1 sugar ABC transporter [Rhizobium rhizogenes K84]OCJ15816.1 lipase [Agrobacterium sp. B131/95]MDJ1633938.1 sugar ABC transporter ATP-binding protein [Rhizobium rhizogenes]NTG77391.1 sugar ABC transporter ATP-binding protein [Rhizobium rhizogenes]NTI45441.1 sugar ABC transporter ATP-binding protein [Rhizobium rhizogenes]
MSAQDPFLRLSKITKRFGGVLALDDIDWEVRAGEIHCLVGENGCGKSTLIKTVAGVHPPTSGEIEIAGKSVLPLTPSSARALGIQVIFQDLSLFPNLTVAENIAIESHLKSDLRPVSYTKMRKLALSALKRLDFHLDPDAAVADLSVAERQIVAICRGIAAEARLIFMDEPTASLTRSEVKRLLAIVARLKADGIAVVFVSHRLDEIVEIAERVTVMRDGRKVGTYPAAEVDQRRIGHLMTGIDIFQSVVARDMSAEKPLLEVSSLSRGGEYKDISFTIRQGEVLGITGLLGAGRTELALSLFGMTRPDSGTMKLEGRKLSLRSNRDAVNAGIAYVSEDRLSLGVILRQSIGDNLILAVLKSLRGRLGLIPDRSRRTLAADWVNRLAIKIPGLDRPVGTLSGGNQQRVVLAKWLAAKPKILILDSPTVGVDIKNKQGIYKVVSDLARQGVGILIISDEVAEVYATCDRVLHMRAGRIVGEVVPGQTSEHEFEEKIYA